MSQPERPPVKKRGILRRLFRGIVRLCQAALLLIIITGAWLYWQARASLPALDGKLVAPELSAPVKVTRDDWGVPHIEAETEPDAFFALGYTMAQDRLFQMELLRRIAQGELSEILGPLKMGAVSVPEIDRVMRAFRLRANAEKYFLHEDRIPPELLASLDAFVAGVNRFMKDGPLPFEFKVLRIPERPFTKVDCMSVAALLPITFSDGLREDQLASILAQRFPGKNTDAMFPGYSKEIPVTVMETLEEAEAYLKQTGSVPSTPDAPSESEPSPKREPLPSDDTGQLQAFLEPLAWISEHFGASFGSNSWVLDPSRSASGKPILANDPHIGFTNPSIWFEAHVKAGDYENYGYYFPPIPIALLGHNSDRGWALTMFANDDVDLFVEEFKPDEPGKVKYKGEWVDAETIRETIHVRFAEDQVCDVRVTPHGPVITDFLSNAYGYDGPPVAMSWVWQQNEYTDLLAFYKMGRARNYEAFAEAVPLVTSPGVNISYADKEGNIAWWAAGRIVKRAPTVNPKRLLDGGSGKDEILGFLPFELNPHLKNPECGYIVTANNMSTVKPLAPDVRLQGYWQPTDRAGRIEELVGQRSDWTIEALKAVQFDDTIQAKKTVLPTLLETLKRSSRDFVPIEQEVVTLLESWDGSHGITSVGGAIYQNWVDSIIDMGVGDEIGDKQLKPYGILADHWNFFKDFVRDPSSEFWDDVNTPEKETREQIVYAAFKDAIARLRSQFGDDVSTWTWGKIHVMEFKHPFGQLPLLDRIFNIGPFPASGGSQIVNNMLYPAGQHDYHVAAGPSTRRLIDFAHPDEAQTILPTGNSGNFMSPHYDDQAALFMKGEYRSIRMTPEQIARHTKHVMRFEPKG
ncbi:MAG: penicillin acylase family protein [Candidatus Hydrogenedentes bacterium]|nr:penicillin acylase family protein [Candidatus Hydrogenedentota bacterium]